jgi:uncharacterized repeat protein (TIGR03803 family)
MTAISSFASKSRRLLASSAALIALVGNAMGLPCRPPGEETVLASFGDSSTHRAPLGGVTFGPDGGLYVATSNQVSSETAYGAVYKLTPPSGSGAWSRTLVCSFCPGYPCLFGAPVGPLILDTSGALYGVSLTGEDVFELSPPPPGSTIWTETFSQLFGRNSFSRSSGLALGPDGSLYVTTDNGGAYGEGIVFKLTPGPWVWIATAIYVFSAASADGANPRGGADRRQQRRALWNHRYGRRLRQGRGVQADAARDPLGLLDRKRALQFHRP